MKKMDFNTYRNSSEKERNEHETSLHKKFEDHKKFCDALTQKMEIAVHDDKCKLEIAALLVDQTKEARLQLSELEQHCSDFDRIKKLCNADGKNFDDSLVLDRNFYEGSIFCGAGVVNIRSSKIEKPKNVITYGQIVMQKNENRIKKNNKSHEEIINAVIAKINKSQSQK